MDDEEQRSTGEDDFYELICIFSSDTKEPTRQTP